MAVAARGMAVEVTAVGKGRKQLANDALKQRVGQMIAEHSPAGRPAGGGGSRQGPLGSPTGSGTAGGGAAAAAAAKAAREAAAAKPVMHKQLVKTATGMQTLQLVKRPPGQAAGGGQRAGAAGAAGAAAGHAGASPGSVTKGQRPGGSAAAAQRQQRSPAERAAAAAAGRGRPQFRGTFYGGQQPGAALEERMRYNKRRWAGQSWAAAVAACCGVRRWSECAGSDAVRRQCLRSTAAPWRLCLALPMPPPAPG